MAPSRAVSLTRTERFAGSKALVVRVSMRLPSAARISSSDTEAAEAMRALCALPCRSATTRKASPASGSAASSCAPLPLASRNFPRSPRALATRSGQAWRRRAPAAGFGEVAPHTSGGERASDAGAPSPVFADIVRVRVLACLASLSANPRAACARGPRSERNRISRRSRSTLSPPRPRSVISTASSAAVSACPVRRSLGDHMRQPRRQSELAHRFARWRQTAGLVDRAEAEKQRRAPRQAPVPAADRESAASSGRRRRRPRSRAAGRRDRPAGFPAA